MAISRSIESARSEQRGETFAGHKATAYFGRICRLLAWTVGTLLRGSRRDGKRKQMELVESLTLGNRRQLLLVACEGHRYLVGLGADSVGSILVVGQGTLASKDLKPAQVLPAGATSRPGKRLEFVPHRASQIAPHPKPGADRWR